MQVTMILKSISGLIIFSENRVRRFGLTFLIFHASRKRANMVEYITYKRIIEQTHTVLSYSIRQLGR